MRYETAAVLFRHHADDFALWTVDLPASMLQEIRRMENTAFGDLDFVMEELPASPEGDESKLYFLFKEGENFSLFAKEAAPAFIQAQQCNGCSVRGGKEDIIVDVLQHFEDMSPSQSMAM